MLKDKKNSNLASFVRKKIRKRLLNLGLEELFDHLLPVTKNASNPAIEDECVQQVPQESYRQAIIKDIFHMNSFGRDSEMMLMMPDMVGAKTQLVNKEFRIQETEFRIT